MKVLDVAVAPLASARFHISPVNQLMGLLRLAASGRRHPTRRGPVRETVRALATEDGALLRELVPPRGRGILPIVGVGPHRHVAGLADELEAIAAQPQSQLAREVALLTRPAPRVIRSLEAGTLGRDAARAVHRIWQLTLAESWPVLERELRMETVRRASAVGAVGWASTIGALHPSVSWLAGERTSIVLDKPVRVHEAMAADGTLTLIPSAYLIDEPLPATTASSIPSRGTPSAEQAATPRHGCWAPPGPACSTGWPARSPPADWPGASTCPSPPSRPTCRSCTRPAWSTGSAPGAVSYRSGWAEPIRSGMTRVEWLRLGFGRSNWALTVWVTRLPASRSPAAERSSRGPGQLASGVFWSAMTTQRPCLKVQVSANIACESEMTFPASSRSW
ncbi:hypothetical protein BN11_2290023 [Nostocoides australiense Ben110]|uniref:Uncharacterized protein n=1 Tax=Nostocoides australiense Ben110 TaxID=1193182 RepID=W6JWC5_9MICO|nr:hypothetical protein BN11_2290023 [Tetrasphaera australiensis Ben110]